MQCLSAILILSPYNQKPLQLGADFVVEALTKFINGHGDAQGGAIISNDLAAMDRIRYEAQVNVGSVISPFNAWQIFRGCVTFPLRMQRINESAGIIAQWLETRAHVTFVSYPGLESSPGHELARKQMPNGLRRRHFLWPGNGRQDRGTLLRRVESRNLRRLTGT